MTASATVSGLVRKARAQGIAIRKDADRLVIRGPNGTEVMAQALIEHKADVLALLSVEDVQGIRSAYSNGDAFSQTWVVEPQHLAADGGARDRPTGHPKTPCHCCGSWTRWRRRGGCEWFCPRCHPPLVRDVEERDVRAAEDS